VGSKYPKAFIGKCKIIEPCMEFSESLAFNDTNCDTNPSIISQEGICKAKCDVSPINTPPPRTIDPSFYMYKCDCLTNDHLAFFREIVLWYLEIEWCRAFSYAAGNVVVRTVAGAEPAAEVTGLADRDTSKVSADA